MSLLLLPRAEAPRQLLLLPICGLFLFCTLEVCPFIGDVVCSLLQHLLNKSDFFVTSWMESRGPCYGPVTGESLH